MNDEELNIMEIKNTNLTKIQWAKNINLNAVLKTLSFIYLLSMVAYPSIKYDMDWSEILDVWDRWQSLNVGILAFGTSLIAFKIAKYNENQQRQRSFFAEKSFLPSALSDLHLYLKKTADIYTEAWNKKRGQKLSFTCPSIPVKCNDVFKQCIAYAEPNVGSYLSNILKLLQVHDSRIKDFYNSFYDYSNVSPNKHNIIVYLYRLAEIEAFNSLLFSFARSEEPFNNHKLTWEHFENAYKTLDVEIEEIYIDEKYNLEAFTKRQIANLS